ncbi:MAG: DUF1501 domain-containing protein, partial [Acidobacteria bacterium]|nr:DUF1501 domain-containing protein [Acidobacteriota bacterium]
WMAQAAPSSPYAAKKTHFQPAVKRVIQVFCCGGLSHIDSFDYKPDLIKHDGKPMTGKGEVDPFFGKPGNLMKSPWKFQQYGQTGKWVSDLLPHLGQRADDITFIHSMVAQSSNHTPATFQMNTGFQRNGFPCMGAWLSYGLGSENENLPAFIVLPDPRQLPAGGAINWTSGFLPAVHQGVAFRTKGEAIVDLETPGSIDASRRNREMAFVKRRNEEHLASHPGDSMLDARIRAYELAARMQMSVPEVTALDGEPEHIKKLYGLDMPATEGFGRNCLLARRLLEKGVRFVQLFHGGAFSSPRINWDGHENVFENHNKQAESLDRPLAGLIADLKQRGMFEDTLIVFNTEFGRTPITQGLGEPGRDHHPNAFTCWLAGGGLKPGFSYGASDEIGWGIAENPVTVYDFHATILHLLGMDHKKLSYYHNGIGRRLTDVHGQVVQGLLRG